MIGVTAPSIKEYEIINTDSSVKSRIVIRIPCGYIVSSKVPKISRTVVPFNVIGNI
jgi:hypothetical protein